MAETEKKVAATEAATEKKPAAKKTTAAKKPAAKKPAAEKKPAAKKPAAKKTVADAAEKKPAAKKAAAPKKTAAKKADASSVSVKLVKGMSGRTENQIATAHSLGLRKIGDVSVQPDNAQTMGKIAKISHMVEVTKA